MIGIPEQIKWEQECIERGTERYYANQDRLREQGAGDQTDVVSYLLRSRLEETAEEIKRIAQLKAGIAGSYNKMLREAAHDDWMKVAYIGAKTAFNILTTKKENTVLKVCLSIASRLEADLKCRLFELEYPEYYATVNDSFKKQKVSNYIHKHKVMMKKFNDFDIEWVDWTPTQKTQIGSRVLRALLSVFDDVLFINKEWKRGKSTNILDTTPAFDEWAAEFERERGFIFPVYLPMKIPPRPWEDNRTGAYYTPRLASRLPFIKTRGTEHKLFVSNANPEQHRKAVNAMQRTPWAINRKVLKVQQEIYEKGLGIGMPSSTRIEPPPYPEHLKEIEKDKMTPAQIEEEKDWKAIAKRAYGREQQRKGQVLAFMQTFKLAKELEDWEKFYYVYNCDFRGRIYCTTSGLSPQGADSAKGLLTFASGLPLGKDGIRWLAIHGANTFGEDKTSYSDRVAWVHKHRDLIEAVANDPMATTDLWGEADKPYQFLAFCFEWQACDFGNNPKTLSYIPVAMDGSCNGLQHYSAMLRDPVGAKATNLTPTKAPGDIYQEVADRCMELLWEDWDKEQNAANAKWLSVGIDRKCAKRPVMTLPYGATRQSARQYILEYLQDNWARFELDEKHQWELANYLTPILWAAIGDVVIAARQGMDWLQKNIGRDFVSWYTPIGFPVYQYYKKVKAINVKTQLNGRMELKVRDADQKGEPNRYNQKNGIAPNFVHSIDSTHMVMTINLSRLPAYAMIHDDFGTHAANADKLAKALRLSFLNLYESENPLESWGKQVGADLDTMPESGSYDIKDITKADYFFG